MCMNETTRNQLVSFESHVHLSRRRVVVYMPALLHTPSTFLWDLSPAEEFLLLDNLSLLLEPDAGRPGNVAVELSNLGPAVDFFLHVESTGAVSARVALDVEDHKDVSVRRPL